MAGMIKYFRKGFRLIEMVSAIARQSNEMCMIYTHINADKKIIFNLATFYLF